MVGALVFAHGRLMPAHNQTLLPHAFAASKKVVSTQSPFVDYGLTGMLDDRKPK